MRYEIYGVYNLESGHNCFLASANSMKKATSLKNEHTNPLRFEGYYILIKTSKASYPIVADIYDRNGNGIRSFIMDETLNLAFWETQEDFNKFNPFHYKAKGA